MPMTKKKGKVNRSWSVSQMSQNMFSNYVKKYKVSSGNDNYFLNQNQKVYC